MRKWKIFSAGTVRELKWWAVSALALTLEYVLYTRFADLSPTEIFYMASTAERVPPPILQTSGLFILFLIIVITGFAFLWFTQRLVVKFCKWLIQTKI